MNDPAAALLGHGLALGPAAPGEPGLDVVWHDGPRGRELGRVAGTAALAQDLAVALLTPTGTNPFDVTFGFDGLRVLTMPTPPALTEELLRLAVVRTLDADARVREILDVRVDPVGPDRTCRVRAVVRTAAADPVTLDLGEVDL